MYLLRCKQLGLTLPELSMLEEGMVYDIMSESSNDSYDDYCEVATQEDFDLF